MSGHCKTCGETGGGCYCQEIQGKEFWISVENDQPVGPCLVTDGDSIQYAYFNGDVYLGCNFRQKDIIAWYPTTHPPVPGELMTPEQYALLSMDDEVRDLKRNFEALRNQVRPLIYRHHTNERAKEKSKIL